jgi:hypothetical protein
MEKIIRKEIMREIQLTKQNLFDEKSPFEQMNVSIE